MLAGGRPETSEQVVAVARTDKHPAQQDRQARPEEAAPLHALNLLNPSRPR